MNLKDVKLGKKLGLGFAAILTIMTVLGVTTIINMNIAGAGSNDLARMYIPEMSNAIEVQKTSLLTMHAMRGFTMSEDEAYWTESQKLLSELNTHLNDAKALSDKFPQLVELRKNVEKATAAVDQYASLATTTREIHDELKKARVIMDESAKKFMKSASEYLQGQNIKTSAQITAQASPEKLNLRLFKITSLNNVINIGNNIQINNFKAQAERDLTTLAETIKEFPKIDNILEEIKKVTTQEVDINSLNSIKEESGKYHNAMISFYDNMQKSRQLDLNREEAANQIIVAAQATTDTSLGQTQKVASKSAHDLEIATWVISIGLIVAALIGILVAIWLTKSITGPMTKGVIFATKVADGDLNQTLDIHQKDEAGQLALAMSKMVANLKLKISEAEQKSKEADHESKRATIAMTEAEAAKSKAESGRKVIIDAAKRLDIVVERMTTASEELAAQVEQASRGAKLQTERVSETATAMEEMNATVMEVSMNASNAAKESDKARGKAQEGSAVVGKAVNSIQNVQIQIGDLKGHMSSLGKQTDDIGSIMHVISDIADQTNLLALNAAIEAARAGDAGRGFAVVADEVRKLAEKTMDATHEVGEAIKNIQTGSHSSITSMDKAVQMIEESTELSKLSGESLTEIVALVNLTTDQVQAIATAAEQQSATSEEINRAVDEINSISSETSTSMGQSAIAVEELVRQSQELKILVEEMVHSED
ncbi:methyl-accepting chemotaxis protein [Desulfovibrio gilichinskyi]|uniref:Methyl-accepting chemotaxis protein n=1 Tax=Desulfovibrio gilichinskyi TaxID=1519643 RepID=A0A1X7C1K5_9BACT|nr:HAMP domain-containing methyl-accepting chemotaxis protein [Desulfovibrio gilichinskyi]SME87874.1 methyl-accepting chemotaxis protein [Desulfovibrio gilichinskyi]